MVVVSSPFYDSLAAFQGSYSVSWLNRQSWLTIAFYQIGIPLLCVARPPRRGLTGMDFGGRQAFGRYKISGYMSQWDKQVTLIALKCFRIFMCTIRKDSNRQIAPKTLKYMIENCLEITCIRLNFESRQFLSLMRMNVQKKRHAPEILGSALF
jgi:hypothetical protein